MKLTYSMILILALTFEGLAAKKPEPPVSPELAAVRKVYLTGTKTHAIKWAKKRLSQFTCVEPVDTLNAADAILDLEPVNAPAPIESTTDSTGIITCRARDGANTSEISCSDASGVTERIRCQTKPNGDVVCRSSYFNPTVGQDALLNLANALGASAETHAYLLNKDSKKVLWDYDESQTGFSLTTWSKQLKKAVGCGK